MSEESISLEDLKGIGPKTADKLREKGYDSPEKIAVMRPEELADILKITKKAAKDIVNDAKEKVLDKAVPAFTFKEIIQKRKEKIQRIPTGSKELDRIFRGGVPTESILTIKGEYASGKTQLAYQLCINCLKYLKRKVIWIETESGTFVPERLIEMAKAVGLEIDPENDFIVVPASTINTPYSQFLAYERAVRMMKKKNMDVGVFVVDSFSAQFRAFYTGREMLPDRAKEQARHLGYLDNLASKYNMLIVLTAQVMDIPDQGGQLGERVKTGHTKRMVGGNVLSHWSTYIVSLQKLSTTDWEAVIADAPDLPMVRCRFRITPSGIRDVK